MSDTGDSSMPEKNRTPIKIPQAGVAITEGTIIEWLAAEGDQVASGQPLYRLETEKVEIEVECPASGTIHLIGQIGQPYLVGDDIGFIDP
jgi:pyruvate/2-oxoglutarate dehydrogenase complex dihydrolipoamide acyltransferase (E2) component